MLQDGEVKETIIQCIQKVSLHGLQIFRLDMDGGYSFTRPTELHVESLWKKCTDPPIKIILLLLRLGPSRFWVLNGIVLGLKALPNSLLGTLSIHNKKRDYHERKFFLPVFFANWKIMPNIRHVRDRKRERKVWFESTMKCVNSSTCYNPYCIK